MQNSFTEIDYCNEANRFKWLWAIISFIQVVIGYYALIYDQFSHPMYKLTLACYVCGSFLVISRLLDSKVLTNRYIYIVMFVGVLNWLVMANAITAIWGANLPTEKVILIGFFSMVICFNSSRFLLILSTLPLVLGHLYYQVYYVEYSGMDLLVSVIKFPLFIVAMMVTHVGHNSRLVESHKQLVVLNQKLTELKDTDALTELNNRRAFDEKLQFIMSLHNRNQQPVSLMILDIDYFKKYNDSLGHPQGDSCLKKVSQTLRSTVKRDTDIVARIGGEEFAVILPNTSIEECQLLAQKIIDGLHIAAIAHPDSTVSEFVSFSIGCACVNEAINTPEALYKQADDALYRAKESGRNRFMI